MPLGETLTTVSKATTLTCNEARVETPEALAGSISHTLLCLLYTFELAADAVRPSRYSSQPSQLGSSLLRLGSFSAASGYHRWTHGSGYSSVCLGLHGENNSDLLWANMIAIEPMEHPGEPTAHLKFCTGLHRRREAEELEPNPS